MESIWTPPRPWVRIGTIGQAAAHADAALGVDERDFDANKGLANFVWFKVPERQDDPLYGISAIEVRFVMLTDGASAIIDVWEGRLNGADNISMARRCSLDVECGDQAVAGNSTEHYADEITVTNYAWPSDSNKRIIKVLSSDASDMIARIWWDLCSYGLVGFHGRTPAAEDCIIEVSGL